MFQNLLGIGYYHGWAPSSLLSQIEGGVLKDKDFMIPSTLVDLLSLPPPRPLSSLSSQSCRVWHQRHPFAAYRPSPTRDCRPLFAPSHSIHPTIWSLRLWFLEPFIPSCVYILHSIVNIKQKTRTFSCLCPQKSARSLAISFLLSRASDSRHLLRFGTISDIPRLKHTLALCKATLAHLESLGSQTSFLPVDSRRLIDMATQEELATLFARNLSLHTTYVAPAEELAPPVQQQSTYSISQHYNHSAHVAQHPQRPCSEPPQTEQLTVELVLSRNGVDPSALYPSQIDLFRTADEAQKLRLVELWRICPPEYSGNIAKNLLGLSDSTTSLQQEEALAKLRYDRMAMEEKSRCERMMLEERMSRTGGDQQGMDSDTMSDSSTHQPLTPIQGGDGRWGSTQVAEPYMQSGYETLAQREYEQSAAPSKDIYSHFGTANGGPNYNHATDPVYNVVEDSNRYSNVGGDWHRLMEQKKQAMENQYGHFQYGSCIRQGEDEEML